MWSSSAHVNEEMKDFFLSPSLQWQIFSCLSEWASWYRSTFLPGFKDISRVCVPQLASMAAIVSLAFGLDLPAPGTNPRLFWTWGHKQCGQPTLCIPAPYLPLSGPWVLRWGLGPAGQTEGALCTWRSGQTCLLLSLSPCCSVYTGNWSAMLAP